MYVFQHRSEKLKKSAVIIAVFAEFVKFIVRCTGVQCAFAVILEVIILYKSDCTLSSVNNLDLKN